VVPVCTSRDCELKVWRVETDSCVRREDDWGLKCALVDLV